MHLPYYLLYMYLLSRAVLSMHESLPNFCHYTQSERYGKIMHAIFKIPGFKLSYGEESSDSFTTFEIGEESKTMYLNLEQIEEDDGEGSSDFYKKPNLGKARVNEDFGRIIFHVENVVKLYSYMKHDEYISYHIIFENEPTNAPWGERFFHIREPN